MKKNDLYTLLGAVEGIPDYGDVMKMEEKFTATMTESHCFYTMLGCVFLCGGDVGLVLLRLKYGGTKEVLKPLLGSR
jgi:hypothetical protein